MSAPRPSGQRDQCSPPRPGDTVYIGDRPHVVLQDMSLAPLQVATTRARSHWINLVFCTSCLRLRVSPGHLLVCPDRISALRDGGR